MASSSAIRDAIGKHGVTIGTAQFISGGFVGELLARQGFDWVLVDLQHGATTFGSALSTIQGIENGGGAALVRVPWPEPSQIMRALDLGAIGVVIPMVEDAETAAMAAAACRYPPLGIRSAGIVRGAYGKDASPAPPLCLPMVETRRGLEQVEAIAATDGVDGILLGPGDLSLSLGCPIGSDVAPDIYAAAKRIADACHAHGKIAGSFAIHMAMSRKLIEQGMTLVSLGADTAFMTQGIASTIDLTDLRRTATSNGEAA